MKEFFRGWRRKNGVVTLLMAWVFMGLWVRSYLVVDQFVNYSDECTDLKLAGGSIIWSRPRRLKGISTNCFEAATGWEWYTEAFKRKPPQLPTDYQYIARFNRMGVEVATVVREKAGGRRIEETIEFWKVSLLDSIIPLTLVSSYLLLSKPRKPTPNKITEPTANEGGRAVS